MALLSFSIEVFTWVTARDLDAGLLGEGEILALTAVGDYLTFLLLETVVLACWACREGQAHFLLLIEVVFLIASKNNFTYVLCSTEVSALSTWRNLQAFIRICFKVLSFWAFLNAPAFFIPGGEILICRTWRNTQTLFLFLIEVLVLGTHSHIQAFILVLTEVLSPLCAFRDLNTPLLMEIEVLILWACWLWDTFLLFQRVEFLFWACWNRNAVSCPLIEHELNGANGKILTFQVFHIKVHVILALRFRHALLWWKQEILSFWTGRNGDAFFFVGGEVLFTRTNRNF